MKNQLFIFILFGVTLISNLLNAQVPAWSWGKSVGDTLSDFESSIATDLNGNVIMTGYFFGPTITFGNIVLTNSGSADIFIVKYDGFGNVLWAKSAVGVKDDRSNCITTDVNGNILIAGSFNSPTITFGNIILTQTGGSILSDVFIVKYDSGGNVIWAKNALGAESDYASAVATDSNGNVFLTGSFYSDSIVFDTTTLTNTWAGFSDIFVAKLGSAGNVLWARSTGGTAYDNSFCLTTDGLGNTIVAGRFDSYGISFGNVLNAFNFGSYDIFIMKYDANGNVLWAGTFGGIYYEVGASITTDANNNVYLTGQFTSDTIYFGNTTLIRIGNSNFFIAKFDAAGNILWAKNSSGGGNELSNCVSTDANGCAFIAGSFNSPQFTFGSTTLVNEGSSDAFIAKYDIAGNEMWAKSVGGSYIDNGISVSADASGGVFFAGCFRSNYILIGSNTYVNSSLINYNDIFIAKLGGFTSYNEFNNKDIFNIYPNPSTDFLTIKTKTSVPLTFAIYNLLGQEKVSETIKGDAKIDVSMLGSGVYVYRVYDGDKDLKVGKLMKQ